MVPSARLLWCVLGLGLPAAVLGGLMPDVAILAVAVLAALTAWAAADAWMSRAVLQDVTVTALEIARLYRDREGEFTLQFRFGDATPRTLLVGVPFPEAIAAAEEVRTVQFPGADVADLPWPCTGKRRGQHRVDAVYLEAPSHFGLWSIREKKPVALEFRVYPNLRQPDALAALRRGSQGMNSLRQIGKGREFEKLREYHPGDGFDEIHWKATARRGKPITKVFQVERTQEIYVILDAGRLSGRPAGQDIALERYLQAALVLGSAAERNGDLFGIAAFSDQVHGFVRARNGKAHYSACRDALYQLQPRPVSPDYDEIASFLRTRLRRRALLVFLTELDDPLLSESFGRAAKLLSAQHLVVAGMLRPPGVDPLFSGDPVQSESDVYARLSSHITWRGLRETELRMRRHGVWFSTFRAESICEQLVGAYLDIKQRQAL